VTPVASESVFQTFIITVHESTKKVKSCSSHLL
jgi:hypothetical protein